MAGREGVLAGSGLFSGGVGLSSAGAGSGADVGSSTGCGSSTGSWAEGWCVSGVSIVSAGSGAVWPDGKSSVGVSGSAGLTEGVFTRSIYLLISCCTSTFRPSRFISSSMPAGIFTSPPTWNQPFFAAFAFNSLNFSYSGVPFSIPSLLAVCAKVSPSFAWEIMLPFSS